MMCQRMGRPPISTIGLGRMDVSSLSRVPKPPARIMSFTHTSGAGFDCVACARIRDRSRDPRAAKRKMLMAKVAGHDGDHDEDSSSYIGGHLCTPEPMAQQECERRQ